ncbi:MAG: serine hydrolase, partial [Lachnospiraceae bacterium]|nr:serine hydrolase [Lachnospiraceae bacterium]
MSVQVNAEPEEKKENKQTEEMASEGDPDLGLSSPSVLLMEESTGTIIYERNADEQRSPASITKIMTLILIFDEMEKGNLKPEDEVVTSAYAKSMGGSQVFLEEGEKQTVETMIKCIVISSGNDASVAMAEH